MTEFRTYNGENQTVFNTYKDICANQTLSHVLEMKKKYASFPNISLSLWDVFKKLDEIVDESDPDSDLPQYVHAYQTGESIENRYFDRETKQFKKDVEIKSLFYGEWETLPEHVRKIYEDAKYLHNLYPHIQDWDWMILVGFIHDLGKVLINPTFGGLPQWSVVGDIFPVGCKLDDACVFSEFGIYNANPDSKDPQLNTKNGIYTEGCGLETLHMGYSHDEYMASVMDKNDTNFPREAAYMIRFHSFYPFHTSKNGPRGYTQFASEYDWIMLPLVKALQKADLYSKSRDIPSIDDTKSKYNRLINKYFNTELITW